MQNLYYLIKTIKMLLLRNNIYISILLALMLCFFAFNSAFAAPHDGFPKWYTDRLTAEKNTTNFGKVDVKVEASKTYPVSTLDQNGKPISGTRTAKSTIRLAPTAANVGKSLVKRLPSAVIGAAVYDILGKSVDWVLDPENNRVKYSVPVAGGVGATAGWVEVNKNDRFSATAVDACKYYLSLKNKTYGRVNQFSERNAYCYDSNDKLAVQLTKIGDYNGSVDGTEDRYILISTVAKKVQDRADQGDQPSQRFLSETVEDMIESGELSDPLDRASDYPQPDPDLSYPANPNNLNDPANPASPLYNPDNPTDPNNPTDPDNPTDPSNPPKFELEFPAFCDWAVKVCDFIDWVKTEPEDPADGEGDIAVQERDPNMHVPILERLYISMPAQCPADPILEFMGARIPFPMSVFCQFATMMKPLILLFAYIKGLSIIGNGLN